MFPGSKDFVHLKSVYPKIVEIIPVTKEATPNTLWVTFDKSGLQYFCIGLGNNAASPAKNVGANKNRDAKPEIILNEIHFHTQLTWK